MNYQLVKNNDWKEVEMNFEKVKIPSAWFNSSLGKLCDVRDGTHESPKFIEKGFPFITTKNLVNGKIDFSTAKFISKEDHENFIKRSNVEDGDILTGMIGTIGNPVMIKNKKVDFSIKNVGLIKSENKINQLFLFYNFRNYLNNKTTKEDGGVVKFMSLGDLRAIELLYPDENQQKSIASILSKQETIVLNIEKLIEKSEIIFNDLSEQLLSGELRLKEEDGKVSIYKNSNDNWEEKEVNGEMIKIPRDWSVTTFPEKLIFKNGTAFKKEFIGNVGKPIIKIQHLSNKDAKVEYYSSTEDKLVNIKKGDILFAWSGTIDVFEYGGPDAYLNQHIFRVNYKYENIPYFSYLLKKEINKMNTNGLTMQHITLKELNMHQFFYSKNIEEQKLISNMIVNGEHKIKNLRKLLTKEKEKFDWLLDNLLSGKYLVKEMEK